MLLQGMFAIGVPRGCYLLPCCTYTEPRTQGRDSLGYPGQQKSPTGISLLAALAVSAASPSLSELGGAETMML